ncbi:GatB/YqeY domain-containing protein, partial [Mesorhizobium sp.]|uniref:GatB/YqeY domain-containing protein n=1 Tax=Mesorhizobium sp. TaxID=1871066 RepID=UPI00257E849B
MRSKIAESLKSAMKAQDKRRLPTLRLIQAAIHDRDIANRGAGKEPASDDEILQILAKMAKQ